MDTAADTDLAPMTRAAFRAWVESLPRGKYERLDGRPVKKDVERAIHNVVKMQAWLALRNAAAGASVPCTETIVLDPPGLLVPVASLFAELPPA